MKFIKKKDKFYRGVVFEFNLPSGHSCPFAKDCKVKVDEKTGKFDIIGEKFRCYASSSERFPAVRKHRWDNFRDVLSGKEIVVPKEAKFVRIHASGDFFSQKYFDSWLDACKKNPNVRFWAFTKSVQFWVNRLNEIPSNLILQASKGGFQDELIDQYNLKYAEVFSDINKIPKGIPIDTNDDYARDGTQSFALLDNFKFKKNAPLSNSSSDKSESFNKDLTDFQKENPKSASQTSLNPDIKLNLAFCLPTL